MSKILNISNETQFYLAALLLGVVIGLAVESIFHLVGRFWTGEASTKSDDGSSRSYRKRSPWPKAIMPTNRVMDATEQLRIVMEASFSSQPLLNKGETRVFVELNAIVSAHNPLWRVMAQVSLGEILRSEDEQAYRCINSKRVDLLLIDENCSPRHVVEYQGHGHHQGTAAARDAVKKEALRRAGIGYHEVVAGHTTPAELKQLIQKLVSTRSAETVPGTNRSFGARR